eukprot:gb/GFBE01054772.1/.p1 GENE.gb/GFBE01054772.1/~~gb/GFBE01054772.1/.p1  ORF type:complete len:203 (+),score=67.94 gb/GFBE01054772.1/:1-609(+)
MARQHGSSLLVLPLLLLACGPEVAQGSAVEILTKVKTFRDAGIEVFTGMSASLKEKGQEASAEKAQRFSDDWLSILGVQKGLTGLAKDFALNYLGRESYHSKNGPLVDAIKQVAMSLPSGGSTMEEDDLDDLKYYLKRVCFEGKRLFAPGGSLHEMLSDLLEIVDAKGADKALAETLRNSQQVKEALSYFAGPASKAGSQEL